MNEVTYVNISDKAGVYMILNLNNRKIYIGQSTHMKRRGKTHFGLLKVGKHHNKELQKDFDNGDDFLITMLEYIRNESSLLISERLYIYYFKECCMKLYNHETKEQLQSLLFYDFVRPMVEMTSRKSHKRLRCYPYSLTMCKKETLLQKFNN